MLDSNTTSNLNLDSGTLKDKDAVMIQTKQGNQVDPFMNFDYDKNQSKHQDDERYPDPPSFLLKVNDKTQQESTDQKMNIQEKMKDIYDDRQQMQPQIQESQLTNEDQDQRNQRQAQGLPQPYEPTVYYDFKDFPDLKWEPFKDE